LRTQRTIAKTVSVTGFGYWSGLDVTVEFRPASPDSGVVFVRRDLSQPIRIPAHVTHRIETPRRTTLVAGSASVEMVEHVLAACAGLQVDNCEIWVDGSEMPGCDGSSLAFVEALLRARIVPQTRRRPQLIVTEPVRVGDERCWVEARPAPGEILSLRYNLDYGPKSPIGRKSYRAHLSPDLFARELAPARTFLLEEEANWLQQQGLGKRVSCRDLLVFGPTGLIDNALRFPDECVRHKALDLVGDLALLGCDLVGQVVAHRSGHRLNAELVRALLVEGQLVCERRKSA
jgi:UDP-3-O-acyl N-acetylglucosamine deacetylase